MGHLNFLSQIIETYRSMPMDVHVVVLSDAPKDLGPDVEVIVGLPAKNPWTLPFAHKVVFAQRVERFDLFIYSEDDIGVSENQIRAFQKATAQLEPDEIAGFLRYEVNTEGEWFLTEPWGHFHWKPASVKQRGDYTIAEFTNEHAGFYILTQWQLKQAIASGGFLRAPYKARYSWPETAATDPYTSCGFRKVICVSALDDFLVHHLPNRYVNDLPVSLPVFRQQIETLIKIRDGTHTASTLCEVVPVAWYNSWQKTYFEKPSHDLTDFVHVEKGANVLSIGCGWGATEQILKTRGAEITAFPLDSVIGADIARSGIEVIYGSLGECFEKLAGRQFDCVLMTNLLHLQQSPIALIKGCIRSVREGGRLVLSGPNFDRLPWLAKRILGLGGFQKLRSFEQSGINICGPKSIGTALASAGFGVQSIRWVNHEIYSPGFGRARVSLGRFTARDWILCATRNKQASSSVAQHVADPSDILTPIDR
jgi:2-polyprenyl-3-methyl-5-hydroxy-6-metoxy-1,4-benzoquinol methylase